MWVMLPWLEDEEGLAVMYYKEKQKMTGKEATDEALQTKCINLIFDGFYTEGNLDNFPDIPGLYCIYAGNINSDRIMLRKLLYIGKSTPPEDRLDCEHEALKNCRGELSKHEKFFISFAPVPKADLDVAEKALIFYYHNYCEHLTNVQNTQSFNPDDRTCSRVKMTVTGKGAPFPAEFSLENPTSIDDAK